MGNTTNVVVGAGALGRAVAGLLLERGEPVRLVDEVDQRELPEGAEFMKADATRASSAREACEGAAAVYLCAWPYLPDWYARYPALQDSVVEAAAAAGATLIAADDLYAYGRVEGPVTEDTPEVGGTRKGDLRVEMARELLARTKRGDLRAAIARGPDLYGAWAGQTSAFGGRVFWPAVRGEKITVMGKLDTAHTVVWATDYARAMITLADRIDASTGQVWLVPSAPTMTQRELLHVIVDEATPGKTAQISVTPSMVFKGIGLFVPYMKELNELLYQWERPLVVDHSKFAAAFGPVEVTPHRVAIRETLPWYRTHKDPKAK